MTNNPDIDEVLIEIGEAMQELTEGEQGGGRYGEENDLKKAGRGIDELRKMSETANDAGFHAYVLWAFLDDLWNNITMVPSTLIDDEDIVELLETVGAELQKMGELYEDPLPMEFYHRFSNAYTEYIDEMKVESDSEKLKLGGFL